MITGGFREHSICLQLGTRAHLDELARSQRWG
jgi:hypothetical protein